MNVITQNDMQLLAEWYLGHDRQNVVLLHILFGINQRSVLFCWVYRLKFTTCRKYMKTDRRKLLVIHCACKARIYTGVKTLSRLARSICLTNGETIILKERELYTSFTGSAQMANCNIV